MPHSKKLFDQFIIDHMPLINYQIARLKAAGKIPHDVDYNDLHHAGHIGLINALANYNPQKKTRQTETKFSTYALWRIKGHIADHIHQHYGLPKSIIAQARQMRPRDGESDTGSSEPSPNKTVELSPEEKDRILQRANAHIAQQPPTVQPQQTTQPPQLPPKPTYKPPTVAPKTDPDDTSSNQ